MEKIKAFFRSSWWGEILIIAGLAILLVLFGYWVATAQTPPVCDNTNELRWNLNSEPDMALYRLYATDTPGGAVPGTTVAVLELPHDMTNPETLPDGTPVLRGTLSPDSIPDGLMYFVVTAVDTSGNESLVSNEVSCDVQLPPSQVQGLAIVQIGQ